MRQIRQSELERLVDVARARYQAEALPVLQNSRTSQPIVVLTIVAILLILARLRDQLPTVTLPDVPVLVMAPFVLLFALLALRHLNVQIALPALPRIQTEPLMLQLNLHARRLAAKTRLFADSFVCHKNALAEPAGLLSAYFNASVLIVLTWRERIQAPRVVEMFVAHLRAYIDMRNIRELVERIGRWVVLPTPHIDACEFTTLILNLIPLRAAANEPRAIALRC